jgi:hypothetical protein
MVSASATVLVIAFSSHAEQKLSARAIRRRDVERIIARPDEVFEDIEHDAEVAVGKVDGGFLVAVLLRVDSDIRLLRSTILANS